jgi:hypothetical protein
MIAPFGLGEVDVRASSVRLARAATTAALIVGSAGWGSSAMAGTVRSIDTTLRGASRPAPASKSMAHVPRIRADLVITFTDPLNGYHPMGITSDGSSYYTTNGGNSSACVVNTFDLTGSLTHTTSCSLDNRAIIWDPANGGVFTKTYFQTSNRVDPVTGRDRLIGSGWFAYPQSSPALLGTQFLLEHESGTIRVLHKVGGSLDHTLTGFHTGGYPSNEAVALDGSNEILTWDGTTVFVQDQNANVLATITIPSGHYGFSLSYTNGLLFTADDVNGSGNATWYGYDIGR